MEKRVKNKGEEVGGKLLPQSLDKVVSLVLRQVLPAVGDVDRYFAGWKAVLLEMAV